MQFTHVTRMSIIKTAYDIIEFPKPKQTKPTTWRLSIHCWSLQRSEKKLLCSSSRGVRRGGHVSSWAQPESQRDGDDAVDRQRWLHAGEELGGGEVGVLERDSEGVEDSWTHCVQYYLSVRHQFHHQHLRRTHRCSRALRRSYCSLCYRNLLFRFHGLSLSFSLCLWIPKNYCYVYVG